MERARSAGRSCLIAVISALLIAACGGGGHSRTTGARENGESAPQVIDIYSSLPLVGPSAGAGRAVLAGIRTALRQAHGHAGHFRVNYRSLNDARRGHGPWDEAQTAGNARRAATDAGAALYIGELASPATEVSLPILNQAGLPQISPSSPYVGLTEQVQGVTASGEPASFYPSGVRTFLRLAPNDSVQAASMLLALHQADCTRMALLEGQDPEHFGQQLSGLIELQKADYGMKIVTSADVPGALARLGAYGVTLRTLLPQCVVYAGLPSADAVRVANEVHAVLPHAPIMVSDRACGPSWTSAAAGGVQVGVDRVVECVLPTIPPHATYAGYGYAAMRLALQTIAGLGAAGADRSQLIKALFSAQVTGSPLGSFQFDSLGNTSRRVFGLYRIGPNGNPVLLRAVEPDRVYVGNP